MISPSKPFKEPISFISVDFNNTQEQDEYPPSFQPIFDAHDLVAALYERIPPENKWKRLAMKKALLNPNLRKAEDAVSQQCRIVLDDKRPTRERELAARRIAEGMQYWKQLILGRS